MRYYLQLGLVVILVSLLESPLYGAQPGIKYIRSVSEYPDRVLADFERFSDDRIGTIMISLPWEQWEPSEGQINQGFIQNGLAPVLEFAEQRDMSVVICSHNDYLNGVNGNWTIPSWIRSKEGYVAPSSTIKIPEFRNEQIQYINRLIDATKDYPAVVGYNILNESVAATQYYINDPAGRQQFDDLWAGTIEIAEAVRFHVDSVNASQFITVGQAAGDAQYASYMWNHNGTVDLHDFYTNTLGKIGGQRASSLEEASLWYPDGPKVRTEGRIYGAGLYDYNAAYDHEGLANSAPQNMEAFYVWRVGSPSGPTDLHLFDDRNNTRPTPYYWALRDIASGVDSFETILQADLPGTTWTEQLAFDPNTARAGISAAWSGTGTIVGQKDRLPPQAPLSTIAATVTLGSGEQIARQVISDHWLDAEVDEWDAFVFLGRADVVSIVDLVVEVGGARITKQIQIGDSDWQQYQVSFAELGIALGDIGLIEEVGFENTGAGGVTFDIDEFLIRPAILHGDISGDGFVGIIDLNFVLSVWNTNGSADPRADINGDGFVGIEDLNIVLGNWNAGAPASEALAVIPEPATAILMLHLMGAALAVRRQRRL
jgi:hypothetical protein